MVSPTIPSPQNAPTLPESAAGPNAALESAKAKGHEVPGANHTAYDTAVLKPSEDKPVKRRTAGWKFFDFVVYGLINFGGNVASAFWIANKMYDKKVLGEEFTGAGKLLTPFYAAGQFAENKIFGPFFHHNLKEKPAKQMTGMFSAVIALSWGGTLMLAPVKLLEDYKTSIVRGIDKTFDGIRRTFGGGPDQTEMEERQETYKLLDSQQVKKTWGQAIRARLFSVGVGVLGGLGLLILIDPKHEGIDRLATGYTKSVSPHLRKVSWLRGIAPTPAPEMELISQAGGVDKFLRSRNLTPGSEDAITLMKDINTRNKPAWNVSNLAVELSGSAITAGMFYVKMMFEELFGTPQEVKTEKAAGHTTKELAQAALAANAETPATDLDRAAAAQPRKSFAEKVGKREESEPKARDLSDRAASFSRDGLTSGVEKSRADAALTHAMS